MKKKGRRESGVGKERRDGTSRDEVCEDEPLQVMEQELDEMTAPRLLEKEEPHMHLLKREKKENEKEERERMGQSRRVDVVALILPVISRGSRLTGFHTYDTKTTNQGSQRPISSIPQTLSQNPKNSLQPSEHKPTRPANRQTALHRR